MSGRLGDLSKEQKEALKKFKVVLKDVLQERHDDKLLLRFLRAREFDLEKSELMFREDVDWRKSMHSDTLLTDWEMPEVLAKHWGGGIIGDDADGRPVYLDPYGKRDNRGLMHSATNRDIMKLWLRLNETLENRIKENCKKFKKDVDGIVIICDMAGMEEQGFWKPGMDFGKQVLSMFQLHYPELLRRMVLINCPKMFYVLWAAVKPFIREQTRQKMIIVGSNYQEALLSAVPAEILPVCYGGKVKGEKGDPQCTNIVKPALPVPESYYMKGRVVSSRTLVNKVLEPGVSLEFQYKVTRPDSLLLYEFKTQERDIAFTVKKLDESGTKKATPVLEKRKYHCYLGVPEDGKLVLSQPGTYIVKFDNSYSIRKSKTLDYWIEVLEPLHENEDVGFQEPMKFDHSKE
ncbi:SEC14-like protein 2 [Amphiura filiformis]|uniref:SEC14-like protein 2 n=1 Tax=Amphiura filiformis TaxID=82378 RepID=UPI003B210149